MTRYTLMVDWKARRESVEQCADRLWEFLRVMRECEDLFAQWYDLGRSRADALKRKIDVASREVLLGLLAKGRNRRDDNGEVIEELGFSFSAWNGREYDRECGLYVGCGCYGKWVGNSVSLNLPWMLGELADPARASRLLEAAARAWDPDAGGVYSIQEAVEHIERQRKSQRRDIFVDWIVYVSGRLKRLKIVPSPSSLHLVDDIGAVIVVQPRPPVRDNPEDLKNIRAIEALLWDK